MVTETARASRVRTLSPSDDRQDHPGGKRPRAHPVPVRAGKANEHTDQRVIAAGLVLGGEAMASANSVAQEIADLGAALDAANDSYGTNPTGGHI